MELEMIDIASQRISKIVVVFIILGTFLFVNVPAVEADVPEDMGEPLQLYSGWTTIPPTLDGFLVTSNNELDGAFVRVIPLNDGSTATVFLMNDANNLYVGLSYQHGNNSGNNRVTLYFDQGVGGGENNDQLDANNENMVSTNRSFGSPNDEYWNGASWSADASVDFSAVDQYFTNIFHWEFSIPLSNGNPDDLNVNGGNGVQPGDELGFFLEIFKHPTGNVYWSDTNMNPNDSSSGNGWGEIRLGKNPRLFMTLGASVNVNGNPTIDGTIVEDAYRGCYQRDMVLTNHKGTTFNARFYAVHSAGGNNVYVGIRVYDSNQNVGDYCQVYFEQTNPGPTSTRNYLLENNRENALRVSGSGALSDWFFRRNVGSAGQWRNDSTVGDPNDGNGDSSYSWVDGYWDFEFRVPQDPDWWFNNGYDLDRVRDNALLGFLIRYYDDSQPVGERDFYWDVTANTDVEYLDETGNNNYSIGWANLQLGAPYLQIVHPENNMNVVGTYPIDAYVVAGGGANIVSCEYQIEGNSTWSTMTRVATSDWWSVNWDTTTKGDGDYELRVRATDNTGLQVTQIITVTINNMGLVNDAPVVTITAPPPSSVVNGDSVSITFDIEPDIALNITDTEISIDGSTWVNVSTTPTSGGNWDDGSHLWDALLYANGSHIFRVRAQDINGRWGDSEMHLVIVSNNIDVSLTAPAPSSVVNGDSVSVTFNIDPETNETIISTQISIDGAAWIDVTNAPTDGGNWDDGTHTWDTLSYANGAHILQIRAEDSNGHLGYSEIRLVIVSNNVDVTITSPPPGSVVHGDDVSITFLIDPEVNETISTTQISIDGSKWIDVTNAPTSGGDWDYGSHTWDTLAFVNGSHNLQIRAQDSNGRWGYSEIQLVIVSNNITVSLITPLPSSVVSGENVSITFNIDPEANESIFSTQISIDGGTWIAVLTQPTAGGDWDDGMHVWDTLSYENSSHTIQIRANDSRGRWGYSRIVLVIVSNSIDVNITSPDACEIVSGIVTITFDVSPMAGESITNAQISIDGADWVDVTTTPTKEGDWNDGAHSWYTTLIADGSHIFSIRTQDSNGRYGYSNSRLVIVDNTAPVIANVSVEYPYNKTTVSTGDTILITTHIHDVISGIDDATLILDTSRIDGETHILVDDGTNGDKVIGDGVYSFNVKVTASGNLILPFTVSVSDNQENAAVSVRGTVEFFTRTKASGGGCSMGGEGSESYSSLLTLMVFLLVIVAFKKLGFTKSIAILFMFVIFAFAIDSASYAQVKPSEDNVSEADEASELDEDAVSEDDDAVSEDDETTQPLAVPQTKPLEPLEKIVKAEDTNKFLNSPLMIKTNDFLHSLLSVPTMDIARTINKSSVFVRIGYNYAVGAFEEDKGDSIVNTKAYFGETFLYVALGLIENLELRVMLPYCGWNGDLELVYNGQSVFDRPEIGDGLGSIRLGAKYFIYEFDFGLEFGGSLTVKLPSGSKENYLTTDAIDISPNLLFDYKKDEYDFHCNLGMTFVGNQSVFRNEANLELKNIVFFSLGANYQFRDDISFILQIQGNTNTLGEIELDTTKTMIINTLLGARYYLPEDMFFELALGFGLTKSSSDFIMQISFVLTKF
ncbi:MAG: hypothetical protein K8S87_06390 [Planctomycetes bacterium]|nr:hypothetical protein [Planctomycetota bacterium]